MVGARWTGHALGVDATTPQEAHCGVGGVSAGRQVQVAPRSGAYMHARTLQVMHT